MSLPKRCAAALIAISLLAFACVFMAGCGKDVAATWSHGKVDEEAVTSTINNMRTYYGLTSDEDWARFVKERMYEDSGESTQTATEKAIANATPKDESANKADGTAEEMRAYIIEQIIRSQIIEHEIKERKIQANEDEVNAYVEQQRAYMESRLMEGVFESLLQRQGYQNLEAYKDSVREQLKQYKLQNEVSTITTDDGTSISGKSAWNTWFDGLYEKANVKINPAPNPLPYAIVEGAAGTE